MAVTIDELQVETQPATPPGAPAGAAPAKGGSSQGKQDLHAEIEKMRERELRLRAD